MVSLRCKIAVKQELLKLGFQYLVVDLGTVQILEEPSQQQLEELKENLSNLGLELLNDRKSIIVERIKNVIIEMIRFSDDMPKTTYSEYISKQLHLDYKYISNLFTEVKGITIQQFIIIHKIELVKELLLYNELTLTEISYKLHYSSVAHLSNQFKKTTGLSPSYFKQRGNQRQSNLENLEMSS